MQNQRTLPNKIKLKEELKSKNCICFKNELRNENVGKGLGQPASQDREPELALPAVSIVLIKRH